MSALSVTVVQSELAWHDAAANRDAFSKIIDDIDGPTDLIVLPEMFTTGFSMDAPNLAEPVDGESVDWMQAMAAQANAAICGSLIIKDNGYYFNRFLCVNANGIMASYDKRHLFRLADEQSHYSHGNERVVFELKGFRICPMVCYDLRFPVWSRNRAEYDLLVYVANWPNRRQVAWDTLLRARAIENLSYVVGVNRIGNDGNELPYSGGSAIIDYVGQDIVNLGDTAGTATSELDLAQLEKFRDRFAFHLDADDFELR
ncbi:MAG: amidohydrolase [Gammaproteobacteria bacterium]|nr:amidohydrolase [Gammaproteobacteria bacterium]